MAITQIDSGGIKNDAVIASKIAEDAVTISDLAASGTPSGTNFLCGNNTWMGVGGNLAVDYNDNIKTRWGTGNDLQIWHDAAGGNYSYIFNYGAALLKIGSDQNIVLGKTSNENYLIAKPDGAVELYYDNARKLSTHQYGVDIDGNVYIGDSGEGKLLVGAGEDLQLYHDATNSVIDNNTGNLYINSAGDIYLCPKDSEAGVYVRADGSVEIYHNNVKKFETTSTGLNITGVVVDDGATHDGDTSFNGASYNSWWDQSDSAFKFDDNAKIKVGTGGDLQIYHDGSNNYINSTIANGDLILDTAQNFYLKHSGEKMIQANNDGAVELYHNGVKKLETGTYGIKVYDSITYNGSGTVDHKYDNQKTVHGTSNDLEIYHDGSHSYIQNGGTGSLYIRSNNVIAFLDDSGDEMLAKFVDNGRCELYFDNSKKLETTSTGVTISGDFLLDNSTNANRDVFFDESANLMRFKDHVNVSFGDGDDLIVYSDGDYGNIRANTNDLFIRSNSANDRAIAVRSGAQVELYYDDAKKAETNADGFAVNGVLLSSGNIQINNDTAQIRLGASQDLHIYHDGTNSYVRNGTGDLRIKSNSIKWVNDANNETYISGVNGGAVELYHNNSKKLETTSSGVTVTGGIIAGGLTYPTSDGSNGQVLTTNGSGTLSFSSASSGGGGGATGTDYNDNVKVRFGNSNDLEIYHDASGGDSYINDAGTGSLILTTTSNSTVAIKSSAENMAKFLTNDAVELYYDNSKKLETRSDGAEVFGDLRFGDNKDANFGNDADLKIYHDGGNSWIKEQGTGALYIDSYNGAGIFITANNANENMITAYKDGAVNLYYNNSKKFETVAGGAKVSGDLEVTGQIDVLDNVQLRMGHSDDLIIYHDGTHSYILDNGTGELRLRGNVIKFNNNGDTETMISATENSEVLLYHNNSQRLGTTSTGLKFRGGSSGFYGVMETNDGNNRGYLHANSSEYVGLLDDQQHWLLNGTKDNASRLYYDNSIKLNTESTGVSISAGHLYLGDSYKAQFGASQDLQIYHNGTNSHIDNNTNSLYIRSNVDNDDGGNIYIEAKSGEHSIECSDDSFVSLYYDGVKKFETTSYGIEAHNEIAMAQVQGANNNHNSPVLFQTSGNRIDGGSGLLYNPAEDALKVNGNNITSQVFRGSGGEARLTCANHSSTNYVKVTNTTDIYGGGTLHGTWNGVGKVLQVLQTTRQDVWSESVGMGSKSGAALSQAITLTSNSNKVLIMVSVTLGASDTINRMALVLEDGSGNELCIHTGGNSGNPNQPVVTTSSHHTTCHNMTHLSFNFLHNPSSSTTYHVKLRHGGSSTKTIYMNRAGCESNNGWRHRGASTIVLQEIAA